MQMMMMMMIIIIITNTQHKGDDDDDNNNNNNNSGNTDHNTGYLFYLATLVCHFHWCFSSHEDNWTDGISYY